MTWVITGPLLAFGVAAPTLGKAADQYGAKRVYQLGLLLSVFAAALSALAWGALPLIVIRTIGSLEGAATGAASMAIVMRTFDRDERVKAMGWWSLVGAGGPVIGVVLGGFLLESVGWRVIFARADAADPDRVHRRARSCCPRPKRCRRRSSTSPARVTLSGGITSLLFADQPRARDGVEQPRGDRRVRAQPGAALAVRARRETHGDAVALARLPEEAGVRVPGRRRARLRTSAYMGGFILTPSLLQTVYHYSDEKIGLLVIARPLTFSMLSPVAGYLAVKIGQRTSAVAGTIVRRRVDGRVRVAGIGFAGHA